jgi:hypothetical protein
MRTFWRQRERETETANKSDLSAKRESAPSFQWEYIPSEASDDGPYSLVESDSIDAASVDTQLIQQSSSSAEVTGDRETAGLPAAEEAGKTDTVDKKLNAGGEVASADAVLDLVPADAATRYLRHNLDLAADRWSADGIAPTPALTQRGLESLAAGTALTQEQTALLLRSALYHRKGASTALRFQEDPERTALVMAEAMTMWQRPLDADIVLGLRDLDPNGRDWFEPLLRELQAAAANSDVRIRRSAVIALEQLTGAPGHTGVERQANREGRPLLLGGAIGVALIVIIVVVSILWASDRPESSFVELPAGTYAVAREDGDDIAINMQHGIALHVHEVTNKEYGQCVASGQCEPPRTTDAAGIPEYFSDPAFALRPVVNVTYEQADQYCRRLRLRLPTAHEWTLGAAAAPATNMALVYPWGNEFDLQRANTTESGLGTPTNTGSYSPAGDSPIGAADMAGNVAEWTSTSPDGGSLRVVKGGSYRDHSTQTAALAEQLFASDASADWIGFRCVRSDSAD